MKNSSLISHAALPESIEVTLERISARIQHQGDKPYVTVSRQLELLQQLSEFELGRFLLLNQGINGYWTHYILTHPWSPRQSLHPLEDFILNHAPSILATQQRFKIFLTENQTHVKNGAHLACIPSGLMGELLYLNYNNISNICLTGIDYDEDALLHAKALAEKQQLASFTHFKQQDAWSMNINDAFDLISSNGLNIYEPDDQKVTLLYQQFYRALKKGGKLVTSILTPPPFMPDQCDWNMSNTNQHDLLLQKIIFADIIEAKWNCFRTKELTRMQLESVGFCDVKFISDEANIFPTIIAFKA